jgi:hypothetical protein
MQMQFYSGIHKSDTLFKGKCNSIPEYINRIYCVESVDNYEMEEEMGVVGTNTILVSSETVNVPEMGCF